MSDESPYATRYKKTKDGKAFAVIPDFQFEDSPVIIVPNVGKTNNGWIPFSLAPRDRHVLILTADDHVVIASYSYWDNVFTDTTGQWISKPTFWRDLPDAIHD